MVPAPRKGRRPWHVLYAPWRGFRERPRFGAPFWNPRHGQFRSRSISPDDFPLPPPLGQREWEAVVRELSLAPQQERIVRLIMRAQGDKQIARAIGIAFPTVRTYLRRVFVQAKVEDRVQLIHRVYAIAIDAWLAESEQRA